MWVSFLRWEGQSKLLYPGGLFTRRVGHADTCGHFGNPSAESLISSRPSTSLSTNLDSQHGIAQPAAILAIHALRNGYFAQRPMHASSDERYNVRPGWSTPFLDPFPQPLNGAWPKDTRHSVKTDLHDTSAHNDYGRTVSWLMSDSVSARFLRGASMPFDRRSSRIVKSTILRTAVIRL